MTAAAALLPAAWLAWIVASIAAAPEPGAADPDALAAAVRTAVTAGDAPALQRLFTPEGAGPGYAAGFLARLGDLPPGAVTVTTADGVLRLSLAGDRAAASCTAWAVVRRDGRRLLDAAAPAPVPC
ncbi:hypothetical protein [Kitasatospora sp. NPDC059571]|uniref:hypothetical protein n=1 Tax=Kitasatospora sp. NPDC059571 TaxID=3346871 RepID=UPI0036A7830D